MISMKYENICHDLVVIIIISIIIEKLLNYECNVIDQTITLTLSYYFTLVVIFSVNKI